MAERMLLLIIAAITGFSGCALPSELATRRTETIRVAAQSADDTKTIHVVGHGWHTGLVLNVEDVDTDLIPEFRDFSDLNHVEVGWGDEGFYRSTRINIPLALKAAFWPTPSVMHLAGFRGSVQNFYQVSDIIRVELPAEQYDELCRFVGETFARDPSGNSHKLGPGLHEVSQFYRANGKYYMPKTCNVWTARGLKKAQLPASPYLALTADGVLRQARRFGEQVQKSPAGLKRAVRSDGE